MGTTTDIAWTDSTFNPWVGCTKVGPGCDGCYAEVMDARFKLGGTTHWGPGVQRYRTQWRTPGKWNADAARNGKRHLVFCSSMSDVFDNEVPPQWRADLFLLIRSTPALTWQLVTKRIGNVPKMLPDDWGHGYPNVWLIATIVNQEEADRDMSKLLRVPARIHGVSYEPALGPVDWAPWLAQGLAWLIIGGESAQPGHVPREFHLEWARNAIAQCHAAGAYAFVKQLGTRPSPHLVLTDRKAGADIAEWPAELRVREFPPLDFESR